MTMRGFAYKRAGSLKEAQKLLAKSPSHSAVLAGGTDLLGVLKDNIRQAQPELLVDLKSISGLRCIKETKGGLSIGALTTLSEIASHQAVHEYVPMLAQAARAVASPQLRNMGTLAGNICQEPRCWYYRTPNDLFHCLRKEGGACAAFFGDNRYHSIFGASKMAASACSHACPNQTDIPAVLASMRKGDLESAARRLLDFNPMPAVTGRLCPHYCEKDCNRAGYDEPVSIREVERFLGDYCLDHADELYKAPKSSTKKRIAIVGAGPAGLSAAYFLRKAGHRVTVFDKLPQAGGMLAFGIPAYRLPKEVLDKVVAALARMGVEFELNAEVGAKGKSFETLKKSFNAVFLSTGLWKQKALGLENEELLGSGIQFLMDCRAGKASCEGKKVLVIGGGNAAVDVAVSALRLGAKSVTLASLESRGELPAFPEDLEQALIEKVELLPSWGPLKVIEKDGKLKGMELVRCTAVFDEQKRFRPAFDASQTKVFEADEVILPIGMSADLSYARGLKLEKGLVTTNLKGVFAGGDVVSGPSSVVSAIAAGRKAGQAIDGYLGGKNRDSVKDSGSMLDFNEAVLERAQRAEAPMPPPSHRKIAVEDRQTLGQAVVEKEAQRCGNCGCVAVNASDLAPALVALGARIKTTKRTLKAEEFFASRPLKTTVLEPGELVTEVFIPAPKPGARQGFLKFRLRNAIDFPIVSVASVIGVSNGRIGEACISLGAVAPVPIRAREVEEFLQGKVPDETTAGEAGNIAVKSCHALGKNGFKVQVVRALIKKTVLTLRQPQS